MEINNLYNIGDSFFVIELGDTIFDFKIIEFTIISIRVNIHIETKIEYICRENASQKYSGNRIISEKLCIRTLKEAKYKLAEKILSG